MAINNRALDGSEQHHLMTARLGAIGASETHIIYVAAYPVTIKQVKVAALGLSGAPTHKITLNRFVTGAGATAIDITAAAAVVAVGTSGLYVPSLPAAGSSLLTLQQGDYLTVITAGSSTALSDCTYALVLQALGEYKTYFNTAYNS